MAQARGTFDRGDGLHNWLKLSWETGAVARIFGIKCKPASARKQIIIRRMVVAGTFAATKRTLVDAKTLSKYADRLVADSLRLLVSHVFAGYSFI